MSKRIEKRLCFGDLPPRVIIHDVLSIYVLEINFVLYQTVGEDFEFLLFGHFTRDRRRNIWLIFSSVNFSSKMPFCLLRNIINVDVKKLHHLGIYVSIEKDRKLLDDLSNHSENMFSLRSLLVSSKNFSWYNSFVKKMKFPHLSSLDLSSINTNVFGIVNDGFHRKFPLQNLKKLYLGAEKERLCVKVTIFMKEEKRLSNLKTILLCNLVSSFQIIFFLPKLESCILKNVKNVLIFPGDLLRLLHVTGVESEEHLKSLIKNSKKLKDLHLVCKCKNFGFVPFKSVLGSSCNQLANLKKLFLYAIPTFKFTQKDTESILKMREQLDSLTIYQFNFEYDILNNTEFKSLKYLFIGFCASVDSFSSHIWPISHNLITVALCGSQKADELFSKNEWPLLEDLTLFRPRGDVTGKGWNRLPNLARFNVEESEAFTDSFFQEHDELTKLRVLELKYSGSIGGENWSGVFFKSLEHLEIVWCSKFGDIFFHENQFLNLKRLMLSGSSDFTGKGWLVMSSLESLEISNCANFGVENVAFCNESTKIY